MGLARSLQGPRAPILPAQMERQFTMTMRRTIGVLVTLGAMTATLPGCGGGGSGEVSPTGEVKPVMAPDYKGGAVSEEGAGAGTDAKTNK
jgi:hypothetical protein